MLGMATLSSHTDMQQTQSQSLALECSVCAETYNEEFQRTPRVLRCGHTFCTKCLTRIVVGRSIKCPICNQFHKLPKANVLELSPNYAVLQLTKTDDEGMQQIIPQTKPLCEYCGHAPATVVCVDCNPSGEHVKFCSECEWKEHNRPFKPVQRHKRFAINQVPVELFKIICSIHHSKTATMYSVSLGEFACDECTKVPDWETRDRLFEPIQRSVERLRTEAQRLNQYSRDVLNSLTTAESELSAIIYELSPAASSAKSQIQTTFSEILSAIQERQQKLLKFVEEEHDERKRKLERQLDKVQETAREFQTCHEDLNTLIPKPDVDFLRKFQVIGKKIEKLLLEEDQSLRRPIAHQDIPFFVPSDILTELHLLGAVGGGSTPTEITCLPSGDRCNLMQLQWQVPALSKEIVHYQIEYEYLPEKSVTGLRGSGTDPGTYHNTEPHYINIPGNVLGSYIDDLCPGFMYRFRICAANAAGLGMWSDPVIGTAEDFPIRMNYTKRIHRLRIPISGYYRIHAEGAKARDGLVRTGGRGAIIVATFALKAGDIVSILCGGMSQLNICNTGGGGGTFVVVNDTMKENLLIAAGGGGGTRGLDEHDFDGDDASLEMWGTEGRGHEHGKGGKDGSPGKDASKFQGPSWGYGGASYLENSSTARSFLNGGAGGSNGGFGGGGAVGMYGGGGGGGYSGGGGGRGGGGGGSYVRKDGIDIEKKVGNEGHGTVCIEKVSPPYPHSAILSEVAVPPPALVPATKTGSSSNSSSPPTTNVQALVGSGDIGPTTPSPPPSFAPAHPPVVQSQSSTVSSSSGDSQHTHPSTAIPLFNQFSVSSASSASDSIASSGRHDSVSSSTFISTSAGGPPMSSSQSTKLPPVAEPESSDAESDSVRNGGHTPEFTGTVDSHAPPPSGLMYPPMPISEPPVEVSFQLGLGSSDPRLVSIIPTVQPTGPTPRPDLHVQVLSSHVPSNASQRTNTLVQQQPVSRATAPVQGPEMLIQHQPSFPFAMAPIQGPGVPVQHQPLVPHATVPIQGPGVPVQQTVPLVPYPVQGPETLLQQQPSWPGVPVSIQGQETLVQQQPSWPGVPVSMQGQETLVQQQPSWPGVPVSMQGQEMLVQQPPLVSHAPVSVQGPESLLLQRHDSASRVPALVQGFETLAQQQPLGPRAPPTNSQPPVTTTGSQALPPVPQMFATPGTSHPAQQQ